MTVAVRVVLPLAVAALALVACGSETASGGKDVFVTGSSTVEPISIRVGELALEQSGGRLQEAVEGPGTGDGFKKVCAGEADVSGASRRVKDAELELCAASGVELLELEVAVDGLTVATSPENIEVDCLDVPALYALLGPESERLERWSDANELAAELGSTSIPFPDERLSIFGPGEESGTYDAFVDFAIADLAEARGAEAFTRADYSSSGNDNFTIDGIEGSDSSLGWIGFAFYEAEAARMKAIAIDAGDGCVAPTVEAIADGSYPFSRSLYIYVNLDRASSNPAVAEFVDLYLSQEGLALVRSAGYVDLPVERVESTREAWSSWRG